ncbi:MAG TPA: tRNA lysidine(34) synthetase TilS [Candidatus Binatia bacterium]|nr:tRNA lysidine(34) synthetase TilS [Candidatus Binatia bacterium]
MALARKISETIRKYRMLANGDGVLAAVSGGPDSVALLHALSGVKEEFNLRLEVAHLEHGIRGEESRADARFVAALADRLGLPFHLKEIKLSRAKAKLGKGNLEALAREERYRFLAETASGRGLNKIATGHTLDDQAETLLMRMFRGSGRRGMRAIAPVARRGDAVLIRPLIETSREDVEAYLAAERLEYRVDRSNFNPTLLRNWMRLELIPRLKKNIDAAVPARLARMAEIVRDEDDLLDRLARERLSATMRLSALLREPLLAEPRALQRRIVRLWLENGLGSLRRIGFDHVEAVLELACDGPPNGRVALPGACEVVRCYEALTIEKRRVRQPSVAYSYRFQAGSELIVAEAAMKLSSSVVARDDVITKNALEAFFDADKLPRTMTVRNFRPGDRLRPLGMTGQKKLKELFIDQKVSLEARAMMPLLVAGDEIAWIPGCARSRVALVTAGTQSVLWVSAVPLR